MPNYTSLGRMIVIALAFGLTGCSDFSQHRYGGIRRNPVAEAPPHAAPALFIPKTPSVARDHRDESVKPATVVPQPAAPMKPNVEPNAQMVEHPLRVLYQRAAQRHAGMHTYTFNLKRREVVNGKKQPEELIKVHVRREPYSVHLVWLAKQGKGREVIYVHGKYQNKMQVLLAPNDAFALLGRRHSVALDDPMVRAESRYPITETGLGTVIENYGRMVAGVEKKDAREGTVKYLGRVKRPEFEAPVETVHQVLPAGSESLLPKGGQRWWFFDATTGLPVLRITHDPAGEVEYYCTENILAPAPVSDNDFNPDRLWRK